jgi:hypothetical protein
VTAGLAEVAGGVAGVAEAVVGAGLLVLVADVASQAERGGVLRAGVTGLAGGEQDLTEAVERLGFTGSVTRFPVQGEGRLKMAGACW